MVHVNTKQGKKITKKITKYKNTKIKIRCVGGGVGGGGGGDQSSLFALSDL